MTDFWTLSQLAAMSDTQSSAESNSLKTISIDHIGAVAVRLRLFAKKVAKVDTLKSLADVSFSTPSDETELLADMESGDARL